MKAVRECKRAVSVVRYGMGEGMSGSGREVPAKSLVGLLRQYASALQGAGQTKKAAKVTRRTDKPAKRIRH